MATATTRSISHGAAYNEYSQKKDLKTGIPTAEFIGAKNMVGNTDLIFEPTQMDDFWLELKESGRDYVRKGKDVIRDTIVVEFSPTVAESFGWKRSDWMQAAEDLVENIDAVEIYKQVRDPKTKDWIRDEDGNPKKFPVPKTDLKNSKWLAYLHRDSESGIPHLHIVISRYTEDCKLNCDTDIAKKGAIACEKLNADRGWTKAEDIKAEHITEINKIINAIMDEIDGNDIDLSDLKSKVEAQTFTDYKDRVRHYELQYHKDLDGKVDGYSIKRGNSIYTADQLGQKITNITADRKREIKDAIYDVLRKMDTPKFSWMKFKAMMEASGRYRLELIRDSRDDVVRYNVKCNGRTYNASQIGANVTALKILREYERIKREQEKLRQQATAKNKPVTKPVQTKQSVKQTPALPKSTSQKSATQATVIKRDPTRGEQERMVAIEKTLDVLQKYAKSTFKELDSDERANIIPGIIANAINRGFSTNTESDLEMSARDLLSAFDDKAVGGALSAIALFPIPSYVPSASGGGGGGNNDLPKKKDDEWEWWK
ncbi:MAG: hypothetical protein J6O49_01805, partial [Bacteroidaceae bacterium]|nr:hypothetical protein [Bacteroidaceae bacterium]